MLVLSPAPQGYPDDTDRGVRHRLPIGLAPLPGPDGVPQATVSRGPDSGLLQLRLGAVWPALGAGDRPVAFSGGRFRLLLTAPAAIEAGRWHRTNATGDALVDRGVSLDAVEAAIAGRLAAASGDLVDVEVELEFSGLTPAFPWIVRAGTDTLRSRIRALLGSSPAPWQEVEDAFSGLDRDTFVWHPLEPGAMPPPTDQALLAIAHHAAPTLLEATDGGWVIADSGPSRLEVSLAVPRSRTATFGLRWSFSEFLSEQAEAGRHLIDLTTPDPFKAADLHLVNDVPLATDGIRSIVVEARTGGPTGLVRHEFLPGRSSAARLRFVRETYEELKISWRSRITVVIGGRPQSLVTDFRPGGLAIQLTAEALGLTPLRFGAQPEAFEHVSSLEIAIGRRTLALTPDSPVAWAVGRKAPVSVEVSAVLPSGERGPLGPMALDPQGLTLGPEILGVGDVVDVVLRPPPDLSRRAAYLAVQVESGPWRTIEPGTEIAWPVRRESRLHEPELRYRTRHVAREGTIRPMAESDWREGVGETVTVAF